MPKAASPLTHLIAGAAAGTLAAWVMNRFQDRFLPPPAGKTAATKAADRISHEATGEGIRRGHEDEADSVMHYLTGAGLGAVYGLLGAAVPILTAFRGMGFGAVTWALGDELAVAALKLAPPPRKKSAGELLGALAAHLVFGLTLDRTRRLLAVLLRLGTRRNPKPSP
jgi:hypothetical protein